MRSPFVNSHSRFCGTAIKEFRDHLLHDVGPHSAGVVPHKKSLETTSELWDAFRNDYAAPFPIYSLGQGSSDGWNTKNNCATNAECGSSEECEGGVEKYCYLPTSQFESQSQPINFEVSVKGIYDGGANEVTKSASQNLEILPDPTGDFDLVLTVG